MESGELKKVIADNLVKFRVSAGLTQSELAQKINYSDKSVSKWERAEGTPDIFVLNELAELYGVSVGDFLLSGDESHVPSGAETLKLKKRKRLLINLLSVGLVWLTAVTVYFLLGVILGLADVQSHGLWLAFLYAVPISGIVQTVFSALWWNTLSSLISSSVIIWGTVVSVYVTFSVFGANLPGSANIFLIAAVLQVLAVLWFVLRIIKKKSERS
ncbi:MAG: helix-turn-helix domain-containing protein [Acutalibacteraceae bacterium]